MEWDGMGWCVVWCRLMSYGVAWHNMVGWYGMAWAHRIVSYFLVSFDYDTLLSQLSWIMVDLLVLSSSFLLDIWQCRDEHNNFQQKFDAELVKEAKRFSFSVQSKVRVKSHTKFLLFSPSIFSSELKWKLKLGKMSMS